MKNTKNNIHYKDRLFRMLFGRKEYKENIISLYNALNGTNYPEDTDFEITTIDDTIYITMKNDVSLLIDSYLPLWEQQSSYNPNMPLRGLMYFGKLYDAYVETHELNIYGSAMVKIPSPQYIVLYNGTRDTESVVKLKLSDSFIHTDESGEFEWTATMYNLNKGKNEELLKSCKPLSDYMSLINCIRKNQNSGMSNSDAVDKAVDSCIEEGILSDFLIKHRAEVKDMVLTEFNEKVFVNGIRAEGREEGLAEGISQGRTKEIFESVQEGDYPPERGAQKLGISPEEFLKVFEKAGYRLNAKV